MFDELALVEALTRKRVELMREILQYSPGSIRELADFLNRDVKNVWDDLNVLSNFGLVSFKAVGRTKRPFVRRQVIITTMEVLEDE